MRDDESAEPMGDDVTHVAKGGVVGSQGFELLQGRTDTRSSRDDEELRDVEVAIRHPRPINGGGRPVMSGVTRQSGGRCGSGCGRASECASADQNTHREPASRGHEQKRRSDSRGMTAISLEVVVGATYDCRLSASLVFPSRRFRC